MPYEHAPQPTPNETHEQNHWEIVDIMGQMQVAVTATNRDVDVLDHCVARLEAA